jgi:hypothetical protein
MLDQEMDTVSHRSETVSILTVGVDLAISGFRESAP